MGFGNGFILFLVLAISWTYADARSLATNDVMDMPVDHWVSRSESKIPKALEKNEQLCTICEEYTAVATNYLKANKTQTEIMETLRQDCSQLHSFEQQCVILVDFYGQLFFREIAKIRPEDFCTKVNLCETISVSLPKREDTCALCRQVVTEIVTKLKDPDSQMEIIQMLLKGCNKMEHYVQECKRLVFLYGPLILANGEKFLESTDICASVHACKAIQGDAEPVLIAETVIIDM